jgi:hypothetical protein
MIQRTLIAAALALALAGVAHAEVPELGGTEWYASNDSCGIDEIDIDSDGTATVYDIFGEDEDTAHWTLKGDELSIEYDGWYGGIEGIVSGKTFEAVETWRSDKTKEVHHDPCIFEMD